MVFENELTVKELLLVRGIDPYLLEDKLKLGGIKKPNKMAIEKILDLTFKDYCIYKVGVKEEKNEMSDSKSFIIAICVTIFFGGFSSIFSDFPFSFRFSVVSLYALFAILLLIYVIKIGNNASSNIKMINVIDELLEIKNS
ncbi:hypothetical protein G314FT_20840 (plasmid) [Vagococcus luciliae]|uniref:Uncharacterized protein n=2 Tax=Vagococcus luciliae TaxID=2920380 RepID=A0ABY5P1W0_9ENTE|nr:hypothetical protein G314FT_20840 [Vagococcus luciliae]